MGLMFPRINRYYFIIKFFRANGWVKWLKGENPMFQEPLKKLQKHNTTSQDRYINGLSHVSIKMFSIIFPDSYNFTFLALIIMN
jgi:hypothetical protein